MNTYSSSLLALTAIYMIAGWRIAQLSKGTHTLGWIATFITSLFSAFLVGTRMQEPEFGLISAAGLFLPPATYAASYVVATLTVVLGEIEHLD